MTVCGLRRAIQINKTEQFLWNSPGPSMIASGKSWSLWTSFQLTEFLQFAPEQIRFFLTTHFFKGRNRLSESVHELWVSIVPMHQLLRHLRIHTDIIIVHRIGDVPIERVVQVHFVFTHCSTPS